MSQGRDYLKWSMEEARMALMLESYMFDCRVNMLARYKRDLKCRACLLDGSTGSEDLAKQPDEDEDHIEICQGYSKLWQALGSYNLRASEASVPEG